MMTSKQQRALELVDEIFEFEKTEDDIRLAAKGFKFRQGHNITCYNLINLKNLLLEIFNETEPK